MNVLIVGTWHLGSVIGSCLADAGNKVTLWDQNPRIADGWKKGMPPIHEPGLVEMIGRNWGKNLFWSDTPQGQNLNWIVLAYDTPINEQDEVLLDAVELGFEKILNSDFPNSCNFFFTSQLPVGTSQRLRAKILAKRPAWSGHVVYQPENLRLGEAINSFQKPDRMVLGVDSDQVATRELVAAEFRKLLNNTYTPMQVMSLASAEMVKHALNSFLATCVVFANELAEICETKGADAWDVAASLKQDSRVGPKAFLRPGLGFAGGTLARDVKTLSGFLPGTDNFFAHLHSTNSQRNEWVLKRLEESLGSLSGKRVVLLGVTYKPQTSTVRRSPAVDIAALLKDKGAHSIALDPMADLGELNDEERRKLAFTLVTKPEEAFRDADAAVLVTEWPQFLEYDWATLASLMKGRYLIDTKNFLTKQATAFKILVPGKPL